jgi:hypothetical protein
MNTIEFACGAVGHYESDGTLRKVTNCRIDGADLRRTAVVTSIPTDGSAPIAVCSIAGRKVRGRLDIFQADDGYRVWFVPDNT